jgi:SPP1 gp7 family putative phage head morphogenesis protein
VAVTRRTLDTIRGMRIQLDATIGFHEQQLLLAYGRAWSELSTEWVAAVDDLVAASADGGWPSRAQIRRAKRVQAALAATTDLLDDLTRDFQVRVLKDIPVLTAQGAQWQARLMASQMPETAGRVSELTATFDRVDPRAIDAIVERTTNQITSLSQPITDRATAALRSTLVRGVALGQHPTVVARDLLTRLEGNFNGGRNRALVIARTELLDAHRAAAYGQDQANAKSLRGWQWLAQLDRRTCPSCWGMHGTIHDLEEPGPLDHQQGRCARIPRIRSWAEMGFDIDEPEDILPNARDVFDGLPREDQLAIMGPQRLRLLDDEQIGFGDLSKRRATDGWRDSYAPASTSDLLRVINQPGR